MARVRTEIPEGMKLTKFAKRILKRLERRGFAIWEQDDGENTTLGQLTEIAYNVGYRIVGLGTSSVFDVLDSHQRVAGRFLIIDENAKKARAVEQRKGAAV